MKNFLHVFKRSTIAFLLLAILVTNSNVTSVIFQAGSTSDIAGEEPPMLDIFQI